MSKDPYAQGGTGIKKIPAQDEAAGVAQKPEVTQNPMGRVMSPEMQSQLENLAHAMVKDMEPEKEATPPESESGTADPGDVADPVDVAEKVAEKVDAVEKVELDAPPEDYQGSYDSVYYRNTPNDNPTLRAKIEKECSDLDFADLILSGRVRQTVPVMSRLSVEFQSLKASDNLWLEGQASQLPSEFEARAWLGYARLAMSILAVNNKILPDHLEDSKIDRDLFQSKFDTMMNMSERVIEVLLINMGWFDDRVGKLFSEDSEQLKNG